MGRACRVWILPRLDSGARGDDLAGDADIHAHQIGPLAIDQHIRAKLVRAPSRLGAGAGIEFLNRGAAPVHQREAGVALGMGHPGEAGRQDRAEEEAVKLLVLFLDVLRDLNRLLRIPV